jgi:hypothetical protein
MSEPVEGAEIPSVEPVEEPVEAVGDGPVEAPETEDQSALEAEVLFQVSHYLSEYGAPASLADIAFEIAAKDDKLHEAVMKAVEEGTPKVEPVLKGLIEQGLVLETEYGGYVTSPEGDKLIQEPEVQGELGSTYESDKHGGQPDVEEVDVEEKDETGVPFLNEA